MTEAQIKKLMYDLSQLTYKSNDSHYNFDVINKSNLTLVETVVRKHLLDNNDKKLGELRAKVYAYEKIIANSNFAPILENKAKYLGGGENENN